MSSCGIGGWGGPLPGDPSNNSVLTATPAFGGIDVNWTYPTTNPGAVSYVKLYRATVPVFENALLIAEVGGSHYYDKLEAAVQYYYWIRFVSINGTVGEVIGPATAVARPLIAEVIENLTGIIDEGMLATSLKTGIEKITLNYGELQQEILDRIAQGETLSQAVSDVNDVTQQTLAYIGQEMTTRADGDNALAVQINTVAAMNDSLAAALLTEQQARVTADSALASSVSAALVASQNAEAGVVDITAAKIGYSARNDGTGAPYDGNGVTIVYPVGTYPTATYPHYAVNRTRIIDKLGVNLWNAIPANTANQLVWIAGLPMATAIKRVSVTAPEGGTASLETAMTAQNTLNGGLKALYTAKVSVNGLVGGFGIYNDGQIVEAGFDVDRFWIGRTSENKRKPFIIEGNEVFIDQAAINKLTFSKLRDESGSLIVENGKVKADYISGKGLNITDTLGNILLNAGTNQYMGDVTGRVGGTPVSTLNAAVVSAQANANTAIAKLADIANDAILDPSEKPAVVAEHAAIVAEKAGISAQATLYAVGTPGNTYNAAYTALIDYLATLVTPVAWNNYAGNTTIARATFNTKFTDYYSARQAVLNAIANTTSTALSVRLRSDAQNVLAGSGGIATGNLTWDNQGNRTGGSGIGMTQKGLAAFNAAGVATFSLDGTTGNAIFGGSLSASAINAVNTINIAGNAITVPAGASTISDAVVASWPDAQVQSNWQEVLSLATDLGPVTPSAVLVSGLAHLEAIAGAGYRGNFLRVRNLTTGSASLPVSTFGWDSDTLVNFAVLTAAAGVNVFKVEISAAGTSGSNWRARTCAISVMAAKR